MSDLIKIKRGEEVNIPLLALAEMGYTTDTEKLFIGGLSGNIGFLSEASQPYTVLGMDALQAKSSMYLINDNNLFSYNSLGVISNLITKQQNDITDIGAKDGETWIRANDYVSIRAPKLELSEEQDENGNNINFPIRTIYHNGNSSYHAILNTSGSDTQVLTTGTENFPAIVDTVVSAYPSANISGIDYTIPRTGIYEISVTAKVSTAITEDECIRFGYQLDKGGVITQNDRTDEYLSSVYATPFVTGTMTYVFAKDDIVSPYIKPLTGDITIGAGSRVQITFVSDYFGLEL